MTGQTHQTGTDRICEAASKKGLNTEDLVINIQGDQPIFHPSIVSKLIKPFMEDPSIPMTTVKWKIKNPDDIRNPNHVKVVTDRQGFALYFSRYPLPFFRDAESGQVHYKHLGFYGFRMSFLLKFTGLSQGVLEAAEKLEQLRALEYGFKIKVVETPYNSMEVDVLEDLERVKAVLERL